MTPHLPSREEVADLLAWAPEHGVLSVCVRVEPGDRSQGWRAELRGALREVEDAAERPARRALAAAAKHVLERFPEGGHPPGESGQIGFVEVGGEGRAAWYSSRLGPEKTTVVLRPRPAVMPLLAALDEGRPRGVAIVSGERVRLARWEAGALIERTSFELETLQLDWRERKAKAPANPAREQGVSSSGHDRFDDRLAHNRKRFLHEVGRLIAERANRLGVTEIFALGPRDLARELEHGMNGKATVHVEELDHHDLISVPLGDLEERVTELVCERNARRQRELMELALERGGGKRRAALGPAAVAEALAQGRVEHLLIDRYGRLEPTGENGRRDISAEWLVERALATSARVTALDGDADEAIRQVGGVAALLRY
ncbi:MAG TPA: VLRF1 family aeRF1-type release factor [Solirubrobacterales bacterium]|jgi:hypothetical protein